MAGSCPAPGPDDPVVHSLLGVVDCNVQGLVHGGYASLFEASGALSLMLTILLTLYVALIGYQLMLGRAQLRVGDFALTAVKLGAVIALATRWDVYQTVVYDLLFQGPEQLAGAMLRGVQPEHSMFSANVFDGLQRALDILSAFATGFSKQAPGSASSLLGGAGLGAAAVTASAALLMFSSLGVVLVSKIVLGMLLAVGPLFIALFLFHSTRGVFEGWLRATFAFAFAPLAATLLLGVALTMLEPSLAEMEQMRAQNVYALGPVYSVLTLVCVFAGVAAGMLIAGGLVAGGLRLPQARAVDAVAEGRLQPSSPLETSLTQPRALRIAAAASAMERRDALMFAADGARGEAGGFERRMSSVTTASARGGSESGAAPDVRLGQVSRRSSGPRTGVGPRTELKSDLRSDPRSAHAGGTPS